MFLFYLLLLYQSLKESKRTKMIFERIKSFVEGFVNRRVTEKITPQRKAEIESNEVFIRLMNK